MSFTPNAHHFEREVASLYRALGGAVQHDVTLAGTQIDVVVTETTPTGSRLTRVVECKAYGTAVGVQPIRAFAAVVALLRDRRLADVATIVAANGFSRYAREAAAEFGIELLEIEDLQTLAAQTGAAPTTPAPTVEDVAPVDREPARLAFVALPFKKSFDDLYVYGIRSAAEAAQIVVERADDVIDSVEIIEHVRARIEACDFVIADTTETNPNVYYELGYADGLRKRVLLIARAGIDLPFNLRGRRHILYENIGDLETRLREYFTTS